MGENQNHIYRFIVSFLKANDPRSSALLADARSLGFANITSIECQDLYFIEGELNPVECKNLGQSLLSDPVTQQVQWEEIIPGQPVDPQLNHLDFIEVALRPGVTDPVAAEIVRAAHEIGLSGLQRASSGFRYIINTPAGDKSQIDELARRLLTNPVIHRFCPGCIEPAFPQEAEVNDYTELLPIRSMTAEQLLTLSQQRRAALDKTEMLAIQDYCMKEDRDLTDIEFEMIAQTWSEHCVHKTFKAEITIQDDPANQAISQNYPGLKINNVMKTYLKAATDRINAPWVRSAFVDNAGILDLDGKNEVSFKVETHNHPSAIEPFGGANTGVGGVIRDVIGVSAKPIAVTDVLCFGPQHLKMSDLPEGVLHPRRIMSGVVAGVQDYGNKIGLPTVNGAVLFDPGFTSNPLVFCGCVGIAPQNKHPRSPQAGDRIIVIGGRTGRDGLRGATFSSMTMDAQTGEVSGASVQIGVPITEKGLIDVTVIARDEGLYNAITDCGAGGLSSAVGEMASTCGGEVDLSSVRLKYSGLFPWEIWLSEAQERMVLAVSPSHLARLQEICDIYSVELTDIGEFTTSGRLLVRYGKKEILNLNNHFLHEGIPQRKLNATIPPPARSVAATAAATSEVNFKQTLLNLLAHPNISSKEAIVRIYDHEIQGATVIKPLTGAQNDGPSDATVLKPADALDFSGFILSNGINTEYGKLDAYGMSLAVIDEAIRNAVAVGANPDKIAILDNFCWGDPTRPETMGSLLEAARGCFDGALRYQTPFVSGKDSFNNEYLGSDGLRHAIPPTLLISALGLIDDIRFCVSMDLKSPGNLLYLVGEMNPAFGGSHFNLIAGDQAIRDFIPQPSLNAPEVYRRLYKAMRQRLVRACHDLSEGGLGVTTAEMCLAGRLGMDLHLSEADNFRFVFGETNGCLV
ncbi:MAG: phosphoribosylformylglycinamidine synthase subunit PurL, partial [Anaerolineae bacterium]|nr:phosphoribosylformylglycinamidine synthase subunit PurL [Anaerolineae bacterium]